MPNLYPEEMPKVFTVEAMDDCLYLVNSKSRDVIASLKMKQWETEFFKRRFGSLNIDYDVLRTLEFETVPCALDSLLLYADENQYDLIELHCNPLGMGLIPALEDKGFRLVDTRISFITFLEKNEIKDRFCDIGEIRFANMNDLEEILRLTHRAFTNNPLFVSRFKNRAYFTQTESEKYYSAWITNHLGVVNTYFAVLERDKKIIGYLLYKKTGFHKGKPIYNGVLVAVDPNFQGHQAHLALQPFLYKHFPEDQFYVDSVTQLNNSSTINNLIKSKKAFNEVELTFYRSKKAGEIV